MGDMPESHFKSRNDPFKDAQALLNANPERTVEELTVLLERVGWSQRTAYAAAHMVKGK